MLFSVIWRVPSRKPGAGRTSIDLGLIVTSTNHAS